MKYADTTVSGGVEILASNDFQAIPVTLAAIQSGDPVVKAGTPITAAGAATTATGAVGILLYDVDTSTNPVGAAVVQGIIDSTKAQTHSGVTYGEGLAALLPGIVFRTNIGVNS